MPDTPKKTRTDWPARLDAACRAFADRKSCVVTASLMLSPPEPGVVVRVGDLTPYTFPSVSVATRVVEGWLACPM